MCLRCPHCGLTRVVLAGWLCCDHPQLAALSYVDQHLPRLLHLSRRARPLVVLLMSDHATAYGEQGHVGHRVALDVVTDVPFAAFVLEPS